ncbi:cadherin EGF LAG seven-pass G-type receptor 2-like [Diadema setosum]|uniref:cadherin EGF LAG seven-pass G-type receptor 2-like n=1 Tax=Diadema setosum TaxID=31175 RepID=UPI003B3BDBB5
MTFARNQRLLLLCAFLALIGILLMDVPGTLAARGESTRGGGGRQRDRSQGRPNSVPSGDDESSSEASANEAMTMMRDDASRSSGKIRFYRRTYSASIREDVPEGTYVLTLDAFFKHQRISTEAANIIYEIKQKKKAQAQALLPFTVNKRTGELRTSRALIGGSYVITFLAYARDKRQPKNKAVAKVKIKVMELGQFQFISETFETYIEENKVGRTNSSVRVKNAKVDQPVVFSMVNVTPHEGSDYFGINATTGQVWALRSLDREWRSSYNITILGRCGEERDETVLVVHVLDVNDNPPRFPYDILRMYVYENVNVSLSGETVVNATDIDEGENALVLYRILHGSRGIIRVQPRSGQLYNSYRIDYERIKKFRLVLAAYSGKLFTTVRVFIHVIDRNDNPPEVPNFEVFYNGLPDAILSGTEVGKIPARDIDREGNLRFVIIGDQGADGNQNGDQEILQVDSITGALRFNPNNAHHLEVTEENQVDTEVTVYVSDGVHGRRARCRLELTSVSEAMLHNSVNVRIPEVSQDEFLQSGGIGKLRVALSELLDAHKLNIFNIREMTDNGRPIVNISFAARNSENRFLSPEQIVNTIYFKRDQLQRLCGLLVIPAEDDSCLTESCGGFQRCMSRKTHTGGNSVSSRTSKNSVTFHGINPSVVQWCECPDPHTSNNCSEPTDFCHSKPCSNGATCEKTDDGYVCICREGFAGVNCEVDFRRGQCFEGACKHHGICENQRNGGFRCYCRVGFDGERCEMTARYFPAGAYMAFPTITHRSSMILSLNFSTLQTDGMIMYIGRYSQQHDFLALEIIGSQVAFSFAVGRLIMRVMVGTPGGVSDGNWHLIKLAYRDKIVEVLLDSCAEEGDNPPNEEEELSNYPCIAFATQAVDVNTWFLDVNTPLLVGSLPATQQETRILHEDFIGCIKDVRINNRLLDFAESLLDYRTAPGCPITRYR